MEESDIHGCIGDLIRLSAIESVDLAAATAARTAPRAPESSQVQWTAKESCHPCHGTIFITVLKI